MADKDVMRIAKAVVNKWKRVGRALGMEDTVLDTIEKDEKGNTEQSYQMLRKWKQQSFPNATYEALAKALLHRTVYMSRVVDDYCSQE